MVNEQQLRGSWNEIQGQLRTHWGQLTQDDVLAFGGNVDQLVGMIQRKTGDSREAIENFLNHLVEQGAEPLEIRDGAVTVTLPPYGTRTIRLQ